MTTKKENILQAALELFTSEGYHATSTSKLAKKAGVSEGLIFRHFENKEGLLREIVALGKQTMRDLLVDVVMETDPKAVLRKLIDIPFSLSEDQKDFWKLQFKLKWELEIPGEDKMEPLRVALANAFSKLSYDKPEMEAAFFMLFFDGLASSIIKNIPHDPEAWKSFLYWKYQL